MAEDNGADVPLDEEYWGFPQFDEDQIVTIEQLKERGFPQELFDNYYQLVEEVGEENLTMVLEEVEDEEPIVHIYIADNDFEEGLEIG